jgi:hypothetical protein
MFGWNALPNTQAKSYKLYHSSGIDGPYLLLKDNIRNDPVNDSPYKGKILVLVLDSEISIQSGSDHYFKLTYIDTGDTESSLDDSEAKIIHPPQIDWTDHGQDTDNYVCNFCWDEVNHRWLKSRKAVRTQYKTVVVGTAEQTVTFDQNIVQIEIQNEDDTAVVTVNLNGESISANGGMPVKPQEYYSAGRFIPGNVGIVLKSSEADTSVILAGHF